MNKIIKEEKISTSSIIELYNRCVNKKNSFSLFDKEKLLQYRAQIEFYIDKIFPDKSDIYIAFDDEKSKVFDQQETGWLKKLVLLGFGSGILSSNNETNDFILKAWLFMLFFENIFYFFEKIFIIRKIYFLKLFLCITETI